MKKRLKEQKASLDQTESDEITFKKLMMPNSLRIAISAISNGIVGLAEALFLVVITSAAISLAGIEGTIKTLGVFDLEGGSTLVIGGVLVLIRLIFSEISLWLQTGLTEKVMTGLRVEVLEQYLSSTWSVKKQFAGGRLQQLIVGFTQELGALLNSFNQALFSAVSLFALMIVALIIDPVVTIFSLAILVIVGTALLPIRKAISEKSSITAKKQMELATSISEMNSLALEIHSSDVTKVVRAKIDKEIKKETRARRKMEFFLQTISPIYISGAYGFLTFGLWIVSKGSLENLDKFGAVTLLMLRSLTYGQTVYFFFAMKRSLTGVFENLNAAMTTLNSEKEETIGADINDFSKIKIVDLDFSYPDGHEVFKTISLEISSGEIVGLSGISGSGKSTLLELIAGLIKPNSGRILIDEKPLEAISPTSWKKIYALTSQESALMKGTAKNNIEFFRYSLNDIEIHEAALRSYYATNETLQSLDKDIGESGSMLSGGQKQRLSLARALATKPKLLLLDEPTSSLDHKATSKICEAIEKLRKDVTIIIASHNQEVLNICDRIFFIREENLKEKND
ncbi:MAG: ABC transporter ATP-binding protein [Acidimicrobiales bacterium]|nr:ABC transporter ATP-binding protein [Acidimicrobiales bacterium]